MQSTVKGGVTFLEVGGLGMSGVAGPKPGPTKPTLKM